MAFTAKDGSRHTNIDSMKRANAVHMAKSPRADIKAGEGKAMDGEPDEDEGAEPGMEDPHAVVDEHGPAHEVHIKHDHAGGKHHVMSMHEDGYQHESMHPSAGEAHEHASHLSGDCDHGAM